MIASRFVARGLMYNACAMALYKRGRVYWYDFKFNGERKFGSTKSTNLEAARKIQSKLRTDLALGNVGLAQIGTSPVFRKFAEGIFIEAVEVRSKGKPRTVQFYKEKLRRLLEFEPLASARLHMIEGDLLERYIQFRAKKGRKPAAINRELATLRKSLNLAHEWKLIARRPKIRLLPGEVGRDFVVSHDLEKAYLDAAPEPLKGVALLILDTGLRLNEALSLKWDDLARTADGELHYLTVRDGKSINARRSVRLSDRCRAMLDLRRRFYPDSPWVFPGQRKGKHLTVWGLDAIHARVRRDTMKEGVAVFPATFVIHSLRHTFGSRLGETGANPYQIMKLMGHSSLTVSQKYVHPTAGGLEAVMKGLERMNQMIGGEVPTVFTTAGDGETGGSVSG